MHTMWKWLLATIAALSILATAATWILKRRNSAEDTPDLVQWPFERQELTTLMDRVISEQVGRIRDMEPGPMRDRAQSFLEYYEQRRAVV
jgi:hypothetical protein